MKSGTKNLLYIGGALGALVILSNNAVGEGGQAATLTTLQLMKI